VDDDGPVVHLDDGRRLTPDAVVVTAGAAASLPPVDGLDPATAHTLKTAADALWLRDAIPTSDALVVVGAGATGVQLAAESALEHPALDVHLVEVTDQVLGSFGASLGRRAQAILEDRGVVLHLGSEITRAEDGAVVLADGRRLAGLVVWTTGVAADGHALLPDARTDGGRLLVDRSLRVTGRVLAAGDVAAHRDVLGRVTAQSAQIALQAGRAAGRNAARIAQGRPPRSATLVDLGWVVDMGGRGVAQIGPVDIALPGLDLLVPVLHEAIDLRHLWQAGGAGAVLGHASGRHQPTDAEVRRAERPALRSVS
jgi:NADH dehydrogenase